MHGDREMGGRGLAHQDLKLKPCGVLNRARSRARTQCNLVVLINSSCGHREGFTFLQIYSDSKFVLALCGA